MTEGVDIYDPNFVKEVFDRCSSRYIGYSYFFSLGFTERWRKQCIAAIPLPDAPLSQGYDLMAGTGESWPHLLKRFPDIHAITAVDISTGMHELAMDRLHQHRTHKIEFIEDDVLASSLPDESADFVVSTFGLKTFTPDQHAQLAALIARILKPGGVFSLIEASDPRGWWARRAYMFHLKVVLPFVESLLLRGAQDFAMIGSYTSNFGDASDFAAMLRNEGLNVEFNKHFFGCATGVAGNKQAG